MTIPNANRRVRYEGNSATTQFSYDFKALEAQDLLVVVTAPNGAETVLTLDIDYAVAGAGDDAGGYVTYPLSGTPLPPGRFLTILRNVPYTQTLDIANQGPWLPEVIEASLDRLTILTQQLLEQNDRALRFSVGSSASGATLPNPNGAALLGFSDAGALVTHPIATEVLPREVLYASGADATPGYLADKLAIGEGLEITTENPGGFETLVISSPLVGRVSVDDETPGYLYGKVVAGEGLSVALGGAAGDERLVVASMGKAYLSAEDSTMGYIGEKLTFGTGVNHSVVDESGAKHAVVSVNGGGLRRVSTFTANGTYTKPEWLKYAEIFVVGGGAGGQNSEGYHGGGAGGFCTKFENAANIGSTVTVTVGSGGAAGNSGGQSSFGSLCSANGGSSGGSGGTATGGDISITGGAGENGMQVVDTFYPGAGGAAPGPYGGTSGVLYGSGGTGGNYSGKPGIVVVKEYSL